jgi:hypothetical protein
MLPEDARSLCLIERISPHLDELSAPQPRDRIEREPAEGFDRVRALARLDLLIVDGNISLRRANLEFGG